MSLNFLTRQSALRLSLSPPPAGSPPPRDPGIVVPSRDDPTPSGYFLRFLRFLRNNLSEKISVGVGGWIGPRTSTRLARVAAVGDPTLSHSIAYKDFFDKLVTVTTPGSETSVSRRLFQVTGVWGTKGKAGFSQDAQKAQ
jgi:hypothetical protein